ncbi:MAG: FAD-dependent oxidoreductase [bacterium]
MTTPINDGIAGPMKSVYAEAAQPWDVLICGGGLGAVTAAIAAARQGCSVLLVERGGRLGGAFVNGLVQPIMGWCRHPHPIVTELLDALESESSKLADLVLAKALIKAGVTLLLHTWCVSAILNDKQVSGVRVLNKEGLHDIYARIVIDSTGDGDIAASAGVSFEQGRENDGLTQPMSVMFEIGGVDDNAFTCGSEEEAVQLMLPDGSWHDIVMRGREMKELPPEVGIIRIYGSRMPGRRVINATQINKVNGLSAIDLTRAEIIGRQQARIVAEFLCRKAPGYENCYIAEMPAAVGVRETRRFRGLTTVTIGMLASGLRREDAVVREVCFPIDIHNPDGVGQAEGFAGKVPAYDLPYGCLVPEGCDGLLLAGRNIAGTHEAHASYRVQQITMHIGIAVGVAAALCVQQGWQPRELNVGKLQHALGITQA